MLPEESQAEIAPLIDAYLRMLGPSRLVRGVRRRIEETLLSAESAVDGRGRGDRRRHPGAGRARTPPRTSAPASSAAPRKCARSPAAWCAT